MPRVGGGDDAGPPRFNLWRRSARGVRRQHAIVFRRRQPTNMWRFGVATVSNWFFVPQDFVAASSHAFVLRERGPWLMACALQSWRSAWQGQQARLFTCNSEAGCRLPAPMPRGALEAGVSKACPELVEGTRAPSWASKHPSRKEAGCFCSLRPPWRPRTGRARPSRRVRAANRSRRRSNARAEMARARKVLTRTGPVRQFARRKTRPGHFAASFSGAILIQVVAIDLLARLRET